MLNESYSTLKGRSTIYLKTLLSLLLLATGRTSYSQTDSSNLEYQCAYKNEKKVKCIVEQNNGNIVYEYDEHEQLIHQVNTVFNPGSTEEVSFEYDNKGHLLKDGETIYSYSAKGLPKKSIQTSILGELVRKFKYDSKNNLLSIQITDPLKTTEFFYFNTALPQQEGFLKDSMTKRITENFFGNRIDSSMAFSSDKKLISYLYNTYDQSGNLIKSIKWGERLTHTGNDKEFIYQYEFDQSGNPNGYSITCQKKDDKKQIYFLKYNREGNLVEPGVGR